MFFLIIFSLFLFFFFKQKTAYEMRISDWSSDVCSSDLLHVEMADEAYRLGPPPAAQSYLLGDELIRIAKETGAEAVHPGYGFLSEREWFAKALEEAGIDRKSTRLNSSH